MRFTSVKQLGYVLLLCVGLASCSSFKMFSKDSGGLHDVDDLLDQVERVRVDTELSKERMYDALDMLNLIASSSYEGDPVVAYTEFVEAVERSEDQHEELEDSVEDMEDAAESVFEAWSDDLEEFTNAGMRRRSRARLQKTRERYEAILDSVLPALSSYEYFNERMNDTALFLGNDLNAAALAEIESETRTMSEESADLDRKFDACLAVTKAYVRSAALPGQVEEPQEQAPRPAPKQTNKKKSANTGNKRPGGKAPAKQNTADSNG